MLLLLLLLLLLFGIVLVNKSDALQKVVVVFVLELSNVVGRVVIVLQIGSIQFSTTALVMGRRQGTLLDPVWIGFERRLRHFGYFRGLFRFVSFHSIAIRCRKVSQSEDRL